MRNCVCVTNYCLMQIYVHIPFCSDQHESVRIGIIGECYSNYNPLTLKLKEEVHIESQTQIEEDEETDEYYDDDDAESDDEI